MVDPDEPSPTLNVATPERFTLVGAYHRSQARLTRSPQFIPRYLDEDVVEVGVLLSGPHVFHLSDGNARDITQAAPPLKEVLFLCTYDQAFHLAETLHTLCMSRNRA